MVGVLSLLSCLSLFFAPLALWLKILACLVVALVSAYYLARDAFLSLPQSWQQLEINEKGQLRLRQRGGKVLAVSVNMASFISQHLIILQLNKPQHKSWLGRLDGLSLLRAMVLWHTGAVILLPDSASAENRRQLRVWLGWWKHSPNDELEM